VSSVLRRLRHVAANSERQAYRRQRRKEAQGFDAQRRELFEKLRGHAADVGETDPVRFLVFLRQQKRGYTPAADGPSPLMQLVDDIDALDATEREWAKGRLNATERARLEAEEAKRS
jgi:hypothetical protein